MITFRMLICAAAVAATLSGCKTPTPSAMINTGSALVQAAALSDDQMAQMATKGIREMDAKNKIASPSSNYGKRLKKLTSAYKDVKGRPLNFKVYVKDDINAFAMPDGSIRIYSGLMDKMTDDELLFVIGHEIGHVFHGHSRQRFQLAYAGSGVVSLVESSGGKVAGITAGDAAKLVMEVVQAQFSQENEREADDYGFKVAVAANASVLAPASALRKLAALASTHKNFIQQMLATHPDPESRAKRLEERAMTS